MQDDLLVLFPGSLGDFICFRPTLLALRESTRGRVALAARPSFFTLLQVGDLEAISIDRQEIADLFAGGPLCAATARLFGGFARAMSWTGHGNARFRSRLASATGGQATVYPFRGMKQGEHAVDYYARCAQVAPLVARFEPSSRARQWAGSFWQDHALSDRTLAVHPGSGSVAKNWPGMPEVAARWRQGPGAASVLALLGPAEVERGVSLRADAEARNEPLDRIAALLERSCVYLGNDSGISHLAALVGTPSVVLFGPTDPRTWSPRGTTVRVLQGGPDCRRCGEGVLCGHRLRVSEVHRSLVDTAGG